MYKVLVVEDDVLIRRVYPVIINWEHLGFSIVGLVDNGIEALAFLEKEEVDVVLTDICMPLLNGIELAGEIKIRYPGIKTVILSAYSEFDYAKKAIDYGVYSYLLKENEYHEISECFRKIKKTLDKEREVLSMVGRSVEENILVYFRQMLIDSEKKEMDKDTKGWIFGEIVWDEPSLVSEQMVEEVSSNLQEDIEEKLRGHIYEYKRKYIFFFPKQLEEEGFSFFSNEIDSIAAFSVYWYGVVYNEEQAIFGFNELKLWQKNHFFLAGKHIITKAEAISCLDNSKNIQKKEELLTVQIIEAKKEELMAAMKTGNNKAVEREIRLLKKEICHPENYHAKEILFFIKGLYMELMRYEKDSEKIKRRIGQMDLCATFEKLMELLQEACYEWMDDTKKTGENGRRIIRNVSDYMEEHFRETLTLRQIAENFHMHPNYFSWLFLEETGKNFIDRLTELRLKEACRLLCETEHKIYEIAEEVGYHKPRYFSDVFKKNMGFTPFEYREKYGK